jgi:ubiquinone/menaquinone biosynthesis C-methylase UbiE
VAVIVQSDSYVEYCRETATHVRDLHELALRGRGKKEATRSVCERIAREVDLKADDDLVDVGCGDGTLLRIAFGAGVRNAVGTQATEEEAARLRKLGLPVRQALSHSLPLESASASVVTCNSVLLIVPKAKVAESLLEISRVAKPGARVFIGEIPFVPGPEPYPQFATVPQALSYFYRKHGLRTSIGMLRRVAASKCTGRPLVVHDCSSVSFHAQPEEFIAMAHAAGLSIVHYWQHEDPKTRYNYLFRKPF